MGALSKMTPLLLRPVMQQMPSVRQSHAALFRKRPGQLIVNRIKDLMHFYMIGIGFLPWLAVAAYAQIVYGPCELTDIPKEVVLTFLLIFKN